MILTSLSEALAVVKEHWFYFTSLVILQIILFFSVGVLVNDNLVPAVENGQSVFEQFGSSSALWYRDYHLMIDHVQEFGVSLLLVLLVMGGALWALSHTVTTKRSFLLSYFRYVVLFSAFVLLGYVLWNTIDGFSFMSMLTLVVLYLILLYFLSVGSALLDKNLFKDTFGVGFRSLFRILLAMLLSIVLLGILAYMAVLSFDNLIMLSLTSLLFVLVYVYLRIFLIIYVRKLKV